MSQLWVDITWWLLWLTAQDLSLCLFAIMLDVSIWGPGQKRWESQWESKTINSGPFPPMLPFLGLLSGWCHPSC